LGKGSVKRGKGVFVFRFAGTAMGDDFGDTNR
jgi:hypothetical protein